MQYCDQHVYYQLPNSHTRVGYILTAIQCDDAGLKANITSLRIDKVQNIKHKYFQACAKHLFQYCTVAKHRSVGTKRGLDMITDTTAEVSIFGDKNGIRNTGVNFRFYKPGDWRKITQAQKDELRAWLKNNGKGKKVKDKKDDKNWCKKHGREIAEAVDKQVDKLLQENMKERKSQASDYITDTQAWSYVMYMIKPNPPPPATKIALVNKRFILQGILKKLPSEKPRQD